MMEVMAVFKEESREHLKVFDRCIRDLEKNPSSATALEEFHRTAHSMKGAARILGLDPIERIGYELEAGFKSAKDGNLRITDGHLKIIRDAVHGLQTLIDKLAAEGTVEGFDVGSILDRLAGLR